ncbi:MAG: hypothetical protein KDC83_09815 [Flavobacteriales bacterium]|nr:hypothetical protein [Flavobacteriales bacterium]
MKTKFSLFPVLLFAGLLFVGLNSKAQGSIISQQPDVKIDVNKEIDEHGNITRYDSTWSWSYSGNGNVDSIMSHMGITQQIFSGGGFNDPFFQMPGLGFGAMNMPRGMVDMQKMHEEMIQMHQQMMQSFMPNDLWIPAPQGPNNQNRVTPQAPKKEEKEKHNSNNPIFDL